MQHIHAFAIVVRDYDEAIAYYRDILGFDLIEDIPMTPTKRWVLIAPPGSKECKILLARAATPEQERFIGNQSGGRVFLFLHTDDFDEDYARYKARGVKFTELPRNEDYGKVVVFEDIYGNRWDLLQLRK